MAAWLTIPDVTDGEELVAFTHHDTHSFEVTLHAGHTAVWMFQAAGQGTFVPLVVLTLDTGIIALDDVVVASGQTSGNPENELMSFSLNASAVRFV